MAAMTTDECGRYCAELLGRITRQEFEYLGCTPGRPHGSGFMQRMAELMEELGLGWPWMCSGECGCRLLTDDADKRECGCDGECTGQEGDGDTAGT